MNREIETPPAEEPFDPNSQNLIYLQNPDGTTTEISVEEWLKQLNTNGRGGT